MSRRYSLSGVAVLAVLVPSAFAFGPLLPWSPVHPGYEQLRLARGRILYPKGSALPAVYRDLDRMIAEAESFHGYRAPAMVNVVVSGTWSAFHRSVPWIRGNGVGAVTLLTGDAVYISPAVDAGHRDHGEYLRHELSHAVLAQNGGIVNSFRYSKHYWVYEGLAVWFGRQKSYVTQDEFFAQAPALGVARHLLSDTPEVSIRYRYILWRNYMDYLDQRHGRTALLRFIHAVNRDAPAFDIHLENAFGGRPENRAAEFESAVLHRRFVPKTASAEE